MNGSNRILLLMLLMLAVLAVSLVAAAPPFNPWYPAPRFITLTDEPGPVRIEVDSIEMIAASRPPANGWEATVRTKSGYTFSVRETADQVESLIYSRTAPPKPDGL